MASSNPYDNDARSIDEDDLIDPDDGAQKDQLVLPGEARLI